MDIFENEPDDAAEEDEQFNRHRRQPPQRSVGGSREADGQGRESDDLDIGPLDLDALAAVEDELAIEIEEETTTQRRM